MISVLYAFPYHDGRHLYDDFWMNDFFSLRHDLTLSALTCSILATSHSASWSSWSAFSACFSLASLVCFYGVWFFPCDSRFLIYTQAS